MTYLIALVLVALAVILWRTNGREQYNLLAILQTLLAIAAFWVTSEGVTSGNGMQLFVIFSGFLVVHFVISRFWKKKSAWIPPAFILLSSGLLFLVGNELFTIHEFSVSLAKIPVILLPFLGAIIVPMADMKEKVLGDFFKIDFKNRRGISRAVYVFLIGFFVFIGHFTASSIGIAMVTLGFGANLLYNKKSGALWNMYLGLIAITLLGYFAEIGGVSSSNLLLGRVLEGLFFGGFVSLFVNTMGRAKKNKMIATILSWFWILFVPCLLLFLGTQFVSLGGTDAFIGLIVGFAFAAFLGINTRKNSSLLAIYFALGVVLLPLTVNHEMENLTSITIPNSGEEKVNKNEEADIFDSPGKELDITGLHNINAENSQLTFKLGPEGSVTKGAFKSFSGNFNLDSKSINVDLPVNQLSTFVKIRDKELMGPTYFNEAKYPKITFSSKGMEYVGDKYIAKGQFTMLGKTVDKTVQMKYLGKVGENEAPVFVGKAQVDRTKHGMSSDPKEGDIVSLTFKIELD